MLMPVLRPIDSSMKTKSSVTILPLAPGAQGQPPMPPRELSSVVIPSSTAISALAKPCPRVLCKCTPLSASRPQCCHIPWVKRFNCAGFPTPVVSDKPTSSTPFEYNPHSVGFLAAFARESYSRFLSSVTHSSKMELIFY